MAVTWQTILHDLLLIALGGAVCYHYSEFKQFRTEVWKDHIKLSNVKWRLKQLELESMEKKTSSGSE
jgi:hypothetical protein